MRTIDDQVTASSSVWARTCDNLRLLWRIQRMLFGYFTVGSRIRCEYRAKEAAGKTYWVDE
jgi:hypothetical protein